MGMFFCVRQLVPSFMYRNVTSVSIAQRTKINELIFRLEFDFGKQGTWKNNFQIMMDDYTPQAILKKINLYKEDVLEQIGVLEDITYWANHERDVSFQEVLMHERPVLFNAFVHNKTLAVQIFAEGLHDLEIRWDITSPAKSFLVKLEEMQEIMRNHLAELDNLQLFDTVLNPQLEETKVA